MRTNGQICIKTAGSFEDPFEPVDPKSRLDHPGDFVREVERALKTGGISLDGKGAAILTTLKLMLLPEVNPDDAFVILGLEGMEAHQARQ